MQLSKTIVSPVPQIALVWGLSGFVVLFFMLVNFKNQVEFNSVLLFLTTLLVSIFGTLVLVAALGSYLKGKNTRFFFFEEITLKTLVIWFGISFGSVFGWSFISANLPIGGFGSFSSNEITGLIALWGSGVIFLIALLASKSILVPWLAHGVFNAVVFTMKKTGFAGDLLNPQSLPIPEIGLPVAQVNQIVVEAVFQIMLVSLAEEHWRVLGMAIFLAAFKTTTKASPGKVFVAGLFAVFVWGILHLLITLN